MAEFLLPYLQRKYATTAAAVIVGVLWASWHIQYHGSGPVFMAAFVAMCVAISSLMMMIQEGTTRGSWYMTTAVHWALNIGILLVLPIGDGHVMTMTCLAVAAVAVAVVAHRVVARRTAMPAVRIAS